MALVREVGRDGKWCINGSFLSISHPDIGVTVSGDCSLHVQDIKPMIDSAHLSEA